MTLNEFIEKYDKPNSIVLLEGKRDVLDEDKAKLIELAYLLSTHTKYILFRSGNAGGADSFFADGITAVNKNRLQVITPYTGHRKTTNEAYETISLDKIDLSNEFELIKQSKLNKKTEKLIDQYISGIHNKITLKAAYIIRDTVKVIGTSQISPATFGIFYDDLKKPKTGGTGHTMNVCEYNNTPFINQSVWFNWLEEK